MMGFTFGFGAPLGYAAAAGAARCGPARCSGAAILWERGFDPIYAHQDREDDALVGVKSTARLFGEHTAPFLAACYAATVLLLVVAGWVVGVGVWFYPALAVPAALLARQVRRWISMIRRCACGCSRLIAKQGWRWRRRFWSGGRRD